MFSNRISVYSISLMGVWRCFAASGCFSELLLLFIFIIHSHPAMVSWGVIFHPFSFSVFIFSWPLRFEQNLNQKKFPFSAFQNSPQMSVATGACRRARWPTCCTPTTSKVWTVFQTPNRFVEFIHQSKLSTIFIMNANFFPTVSESQRRPPFF